MTSFVREKIVAHDATLLSPGEKKKKKTVFTLGKKGGGRASTTTRRGKNCFVFLWQRGKVRFESNGLLLEEKKEVCFRDTGSKKKKSQSGTTLQGEETLSEAPFNLRERGVALARLKDQLVAQDSR